MVRDSQQLGPPEERKSRRPPLNRVLVAAAGMSLVILLLTYFLFLRDPDLAKKVPVRPESLQEAMGRLAQVDAPAYLSSDTAVEKASSALEKFQAGMQRYSEERFEEAVPLLEEAAVLDPAHLPTTFYLGISLLMTGHPNRAIAQLSRLTEPDTNPYAHESHWYTAKAFLAKGDLDAATKKLEIVIASGGVYSPEARRLLRQVEALR